MVMFFQKTCVTGNISISAILSHKHGFPYNCTLYHLGFLWYDVSTMIMFFL